MDHIDLLRQLSRSPTSSSSPSRASASLGRRHLLYAPRELESSCIEHRPHRALGQAAPLRSPPVPIADPDQMTNLDIRKHDRLGGVLHEYQHAA